MFWMEIDLQSRGNAITVAARGCRGERIRGRTLALSVKELSRFRVSVGNAVARVKSVNGPLLEQARAVHSDLFQGDLHELFVRLCAAAANKRERLLVRLMIDDTKLQAVPWEAACRPQTSHGFLASAADIVVARGVNSMDPWEPREVRRALRVLPVLALNDSAALDGLRVILDEHIASGAVELLDPLVGPAARNPVLFERLRSGPNPHVLHFLGHGGFDASKNPVIRLADDEFGEKTLLPVEVFAEELRDSFDNLRLVYLQACSGGRPGAFASAAELLTRSGVDAVVAHLWPVRADLAREAAQDFYRVLVGARAGQGDVGLGVQASRRTLVGKSAEGFSPVLYLRGPDTHLFDLEGRRLRPPSSRRRDQRISHKDIMTAPFERIAQRPFSLILGSLWDDSLLPELRARLQEALVRALDKLGESIEAHQPVYSVAQRYALRMGLPSLSRLFQRVIGSAYQRGEIPPLLDAVASLLHPGVHATLLWLPLLEHAIMHNHPNSPLIVIQPGPPNSDERRMVIAKLPGSRDWEELLDLPEIDLKQAFVVLRLYGGYSPEGVPVLTSPQLTEDDHIKGLFELRRILPTDWADDLLGWLRRHPVMCLGVSALDWRHRTLLLRLFDERPVPSGSLAVLGEQQQEDEIWEKRGAGLPGTSNFSVVRGPAQSLAKAVRGVRR